MARVSGRFVLRIDPVLHERLRREAARRDCSLNDLCATLLRQAVPGGLSGGPSPGLGGEAVSPEVVARIATVLGGRIEGLVLFGSAARGEAWMSSDVDLLVVLPVGTALNRGLYAKWDAEMAPWAESVRRRISPHFVALPRDADAAGGLWFEVALEGVILWDPGLRIARVLSALRREIAAGVVARRLAHGQPYWVRLRKST